MLISVARRQLAVEVREYERHGISCTANDLPGRAMRSRKTPDEYGSNCKDVFFASQDRCRLHGWWIRRPSSRAIILDRHGNGQTLGDLADIGQLLSFLPVDVFVFDYRGYGRSSGTPSEAGCRDARATFDQVSKLRRGLSIIAMGWSLGGAVAIQLAMDRPVAGLVVDSSFTSLSEVSRSLIPCGGFEPRQVMQLALGKERWDSLAEVDTLSMPKLFVHSRADDIVPFKLAEAWTVRMSPKRFCECAVLIIAGNCNRRIIRNSYLGSLEQ